MKSRRNIYQNLTKDDFKIKMSAHVVNSAVSRQGIVDSYDDYESNGNSEMVAVLEN